MIYGFEHLPLETLEAMEEYFQIDLSHHKKRKLISCDLESDDWDAFLKQVEETLGDDE